MQEKKKYEGPTRDSPMSFFSFNTWPYKGLVEDILRPPYQDINKGLGEDQR